MANRQDLKNKFNRCAYSPRELQQFVNDVCDGKIGDGSIDNRLPQTTFDDDGKYLAVNDEGSYVLADLQLKTVNGNTLIGEGNVAVRAYQAFPSGWSSYTSGTTSQFCAIVDSDSSAIQGMAYLGEVTFSDFPSGLSNAEIVVEIMEGEGTSNKVIHLILTSGNLAPYRWEFTYWGSGEHSSGWIAFQSELIIPVYWSTLKSRRDNSRLIPGARYRIIDYITTTKTNNTSSANHQFDIIVLALSNNKLSEDAQAIQHDGDTYFANSNLAAWKLKYCLDNDNYRFLWADTTYTGRGVIYQLIDEFGNEAPYDFKNILMTSSNKYTNAYTFNLPSNGTNLDATMTNNGKRYSKNIIKACRDPINNYKQKLNFIVFTTTLGGCDYQNNYFDRDCCDITLGTNTSRNYFENNCHSITVGDYCSENYFGANSLSIYLYTGCTNNYFGISSYSIVLYDNCLANFFQLHNSSIVLGTNCYNNIFKPSAHDIHFRDSENNQINYASYNTFDSNCSFINFYSTDTTENYSNVLQNVHVCNGINGTPSSYPNPEVFVNVEIPNRGINYCIEVKPENSTEILL